MNVPDSSDRLQEGNQLAHYSREDLEHRIGVLGVALGLNEEPHTLTDKEQQLLGQIGSVWLDPEISIEIQNDQRVQIADAHILKTKGTLRAKEALEAFKLTEWLVFYEDVLKKLHS